MPEVVAVGRFLIPLVRLGLIASLFIAVWLSVRLARRRGLDVSWTERTAEGSVWLGLAGARLGFVVANWSAYREAPWTAFYLWQPGYLPATGLLVGGVYALWRLWRRPKRERYLGVLAGAFGVAALLFVVVVASTRLELDTSTLIVGDPVPDFTLMSLEGEPVRFSDLAGQAVVLNFWATWCPPCRREMPLLDSVQQAYAARGLTIVGVDLDEPAEAVKRYVERIGIKYPVWVDAPGNQDGFDRTGDLYTRFRGVGLPTTIFIAPDGAIRSIQVGELNRGILQSQIEAMLPRN